MLFRFFFAYGLHPPSHPPRFVFTRNFWALPFYYFSEIQTLPINMRVQGEGSTLSYSKAVWCCVWLFSRKQCRFTKNLYRLFLIFCCKLNGRLEFIETFNKFIYYFVSSPFCHLKKYHLCIATTHMVLIQNLVGSFLQDQTQIK